MKLFTQEIDRQLFEQFKFGNDLAKQKVVAKIFNPYGRGTWYLLNSDPNDPDYIWAIVDLFEVETGVVSREEMMTLRVPPFRLPLERDLSFQPMSADEVYKGLMAGRKYAHGGKTDDDDDDEHEHGNNADMLRNQLHSVMHHAKELADLLDDVVEVEPWVITKMQRAATDLADITHYLEGEEKETYASGGQLSLFDQYPEDTRMADGGTTSPGYGKYKHKHIEGLTIELLEPTNKGWKVRQTELYQPWGNKKLRTPKVTITYYRDQDIRGDRAIFVKIDTDGEMALGGETIEIDLFDDYENIPQEVKEILDEYSEAIEDSDYEMIEKARNEVEHVGYTFDFDLGGNLYGLRKLDAQKKMAVGGMVYPNLENMPVQVVNDDPTKKAKYEGTLPEINLIRKKENVLSNIKIGAPDDVADVFKTVWDASSLGIQESMYVLYLNRSNKAIGYTFHTKGSVSATIIDTRVITALAIKALASGVIIAHNHPSGNLSPSSADIKMTNELKSALQMFNIALLDSIIVTPDMRFYSIEHSMTFEKGGKIPFDTLAKKIASGYEGKAVKPEYQSKYGKRYDKDEAMQVGRATASVIERRKGRM